MAGSWLMFLTGSWVGVLIGFAIASMLAASKLHDMDLAKASAQRIYQFKRRVAFRLRPAAHRHYSH